MRPRWDLPLVSSRFEGCEYHSFLYPNRYSWRALWLKTVLELQTCLTFSYFDLHQSKHVVLVMWNYHDLLIKLQYPNICIFLSEIVVQCMDWFKIRWDHDVYGISYIKEYQEDYVNHIYFTSCTTHIQNFIMIKPLLVTFCVVSAVQVSCKISIDEP